MLSFSNKNIVLGVTGGIAAYKAAEIIRHQYENSAFLKIDEVRKIWIY